MAIVVGTFAGLWGISGSMAIAGVWRWITGLAIGAITLVCYFTAASLRQRARQLPEGEGGAGAGPMSHPSFRLAVVAETVAIPIASILLARAGHADLITPAIAIIVALHFFVLTPAFQSNFFAWVGGAMILVALLSLLLPPSVEGTAGGETIAPRTAAVGFGCALILWASIAIIVRETRRQLSLSGQHR